MPPKPMPDPISRIAAAWESDLPALSRRGAGWKPPHPRTAAGHIDALVAAVRAAERRAEDAEREASESRQLAASRLADFQGFMNDVGQLALKYSSGRTPLPL